MIDNRKLEAVTEEFAKDRSKENFVAVMEQIEKAVLYVPILMPENLDNVTKEQIKSGKGIQLPKNSKIMPCLLKKENGGQVLPVFSSVEQAPDDKRSPAMLAMPFFTCVSMAMANPDKVQSIVLNPFSQNINIPKQILEVAQKRSQMAAGKTVKLTEKQFHQFAHRRVALELLPVFLYGKQKEGLEKLQKEEGKFLLSLYASVYPKEIKTPYEEDDFSLMTLNVTDTMQITRIDMPDKNMAKGLCRRIYAVWKRDTETLEYYTIEMAENGNEIGKVSADRSHETVGAAPENGAEIETVMNLAAKAAQETAD